MTRMAFSLALALCLLATGSLFAQNGAATLGLDGRAQSPVTPQVDAPTPAVALPPASELSALEEGVSPFAPPTEVSVPLHFQYQGYLTDTSGAPLSGTVNLTFNLYDAPSGGTLLSSEVQNGLTVTDGVVVASIGGFDPEDISGVALYLGVQVNAGAELAPRTVLQSVPYAVRAGFTDRLDSDSTGGLLNLGSPTPDPAPGQLLVYNPDGDIAANLGYNPQNGGALSVQNPNGTNTAVFLTTTSTTDGGGGAIQVFNDNGQVVAEASENAADGGAISIRTPGGTQFAAFMTTVSGQGGGAVQVNDRNGNFVIYAHETPEAGGAVRTYSNLGRETARIAANNLNHGELVVSAADNVESARLDVDPSTFAGRLFLRNSGDVAEVFEMTQIESLEAGQVMVLDPDNPGQLRLSTQAYDPLVAGVISGGGGTVPGVILGTRDDGTNNLPVAIAGMVAVWADADQGAIEPGDLLTTADLPGHVMLAADAGRAQGSVVGKAMEGLESGQGLIRMLVMLR